MEGMTGRAHGGDDSIRLAEVQTMIPSEASEGGSAPDLFIDTAPLRSCKPRYLGMKIYSHPCMTHKPQDTPERRTQPCP
jgi:hypothetical protein